jgi:hypothetical protein
MLRKNHGPDTESAPSNGRLCEGPSERSQKCNPTRGGQGTEAIAERAILQRQKFVDILKSHFGPEDRESSIRFQKLSLVSKEKVIRRRWEEKVKDPAHWSIVRMAEHVGIQKRTTRKRLSEHGLRSTRPTQQAESKAEEHRP